MSVEVIQNVVEMVFNSTSFEENVSNTIEALDKLKEALNFEGAVKGLENFGESIKTTGIEALYTGVYKVQDGFDALEVVAIRVLQNITDKIQSTGETLLKSLTVEPLISGFDEYKTQIDSVQTILANTSDALIEQGLTSEHDRIEKINGVLDELNSYADMTIYNFTEMTRNIGTFTAAGVELDKAASSIKGIANLAAMSGSNSEQASRAMYQLSQALATGSLKLQDWNSVVNAGMGGKLFQNELIDTARTMGIVAQVTNEIDKLDEEGNVVLDDYGNAVKRKVTETINDIDTLVEHEGSFRESLSSGWITDEILLTTLEKFTAGSEGYTKSQVEQMQQMWEARGYSKTMIEELTGSLKLLTEEEEKNLRAKWAEKGFSDEQIEHILSMGTTATDAATKVKTLNQLIDTLKEALQSGWTQSWEYIVGDFEQAKRLWTEVSDILSMYIGKSSDARNQVLEEWAKAAYSYNEAGQLVRVADGEIVEGGKMLAEEMGGREALIQSMRNVFQGLLEIGVVFRNVWDYHFWGKNMDGKNPLEDLSISGQKLIDKSKELLKFSEDFKNSLQWSEDGSTTVGVLKDLQTHFESFARSARYFYDRVKDVFDGVSTVFSAFFKSDIFSNETLTLFLHIFSDGAAAFGKFAEGVKKHFSGDSNLESLIKFFTGLGDIFKEMLWLKVDLFTHAFEGLGIIFDHLIAPFGTISNLMGNVGSKLSVLSDAIHQTFNGLGTDDFEFFTVLGNNIGFFIDTIRSSVDFSGFTKLFDNFIHILNNENIRPFSIFANIIQSLGNIFKAFIGVASPVAAAFANVFGDWLRTGVKGIIDLTTRFEAFTTSLVPSAETMTGLQHLFEGIFRIVTAVADVVGTVLFAAWDGLVKIIKTILPDGKEFSDILIVWGDKLTNVAANISALVKDENGVSTLGGLIQNLTNKFVGLFEALKNINLLEKAKELFTNLGEGLKRALGGTEEMTLVDTLFAKVKGIFDRLKDLISDENGSLDPVKVFEAGGIGYLLTHLVELVDNIKSRVSNFTHIFKFVTDIKDAFMDLSESFGEKFKAEAIESLTKAILEIAGALFIVSMIEPGALATAVGVITGMFAMIQQFVTSLKTIFSSGKDAGVLAGIGVEIQTIGNTILMLSGAIAIIGNMEPDAAIQGVTAIAILLEVLVKVLEQISGIEGKLPRIAGALFSLAISLNMLIIPIKVLGGMDLPSLAKGLGAVGLMLAGMVGAAVVLADTVVGSDLAKAGIGLLLMAESIKVLAKSVEIASAISWEGIGKGFTVIVGGLVALVGAAAIIGRADLTDELISVGGGLMMLAVSLKIISGATESMANASWESIGKMGAILGGSLAILGVAVKLIDAKKMILVAGSILMITTAFTELSLALNLSALLQPAVDVIVSGLRGIGDSVKTFANNAAKEQMLSFFVHLVKLIPELAKAIATGIAEFIATLAVNAGKIVTGIVSLIASIITGIIGLTPLVFTAIAQFLSQLFQLIITKAPEFFIALGVFFNQLWIFLQEQVPQFFAFLKNFFTEILMFFTEEGPLVIEMIRVILHTILTAIIAEAPVIGDAFLAVFNTILNVVKTAIPGITNTLLSLLLALLQQLSIFVPQMADAGLKILRGFLDSVANNIGDITESAANVVIAFMDGLAVKMPELVDSAFKLIIKWIEGLAKAIDENHQALFDAVGKLIKAIYDAIINGVKTIANGAINLINGFIAEFDINKIGKALSDIGMNLVKGVAKGITDFASIVYNAATELGNGILAFLSGSLDENSPSKEGEQIGMYFDQGVEQGLENGSYSLYDKASELGTGVVDAFNSAINDNKVHLQPGLGLDGLRDLFLNGNWQYISSDVREQAVRELEGETYWGLTLYPPDPAYNDSFIREWSNMTEEQREGPEGQTLEEMMTYNDIYTQYQTALIDLLSRYNDEDITFNDIRDQISSQYTQPVQQSSYSGTSGYSGSSSYGSNMSPNLTSSMGSSMGGSSIEISGQLQKQTDMMTEILLSMNTRLDALLSSSHEAVYAINNKETTVYMDSGALVGSISSTMDQSLGRYAILNARGVV